MGILNIDQDIISMKFTPSKAISVFMCNNTFVMIIFKSSQINTSMIAIVRV